MAIGYAILVKIGGGSVIGPLSAGLLALEFTLVFGLLPVVVFDAPIYTWMRRRRALSWPRVIALGAIPGIVALPFGLSFGATFVCCGVSVAYLTHRFAMKDSAGAI